MAGTYQAEIQVRDLGEKLSSYLAEHNFQRTSLEGINPTDREHLERRDLRTSPCFISLPAIETWRSAEDYLLFDNLEGTLAYVRHNPVAVMVPHALPFEIHFRTAAPIGFSDAQYYSLAIHSRNLQLLLESLNKSGYESIGYISSLANASTLKRLPNLLEEVNGEALPFHLFHSVYISSKRDKSPEHSDKEKAIDELAKAMSSVVVAAHLFSRKQLMYYTSAAEVDSIFGESAIVG